MELKFSVYKFNVILWESSLHLTCNFWFTGTRGSDHKFYIFIMAFSQDYYGSFCYFLAFRASSIQLGGENKGMSLISYLSWYLALPLKRYFDDTAFITKML